MKFILDFYRKLGWIQRQALDLMIRVSICLLIVLTFRALIDMVDYVGTAVFLAALLAGVVWFAVNILRLYSVDKTKLREFDAKLQQAQQQAQPQQRTSGVGRESYTAGGTRTRNVQRNLTE